MEKMERKGKETAMEGKILGWGRAKKKRSPGDSREIMEEERKRKIKGPVLQVLEKEEENTFDDIQVAGTLIFMKWRSSLVRRSPSPPPTPAHEPQSERRLARLLAEGQIARYRGPFEKKLTHSDAKDDQARLLIPGSDVVVYIEPVFGKAVGNKFRFHDGEDREYEFTYTKWKIGNVFNGAWKKFMKDNRLKEDDSIKIWVFEYSTPDRFGGIILPIKKPR